MNLAIIPARIGSKRIKNKNIIKVNNKPIIYYVIKKLIKCKIFDKIIVSTDSSKIIDISNRYGAQTPFLRPKNLSDDNTRASKVVKHAIYWYKKKNIHFKYVCCVYPTSLLLNVNYVRRAFQLLNKNKKKSYVITITEYNHPIQRAFTFKNNIIKTTWPDNIKKRTQDFQKYYHDAGQFYFGRSTAFENEIEPISNNSIPIILEKDEVFDLDNHSDLKYIKKINLNNFI